MLCYLWHICGVECPCMEISNWAPLRRRVCTTSGPGRCKTIFLLPNSMCPLYGHCNQLAICFSNYISYSDSLCVLEWNMRLSIIAYRGWGASPRSTWCGGHVFLPTFQYNCCCKPLGSSRHFGSVAGMYREKRRERRARDGGDTRSFTIWAVRGSPSGPKTCKMSKQNGSIQ